MINPLPYNLGISDMEQRIDYSGGLNAVFIGFASPELATSQANWIIKKLTYDLNNNVTRIQIQFNVKWDDRATAFP